ncbi:MAG: class I SAM-dependent methyltransferase [bacterium]|nr:class I SAM-dependent methyltransferase [bacterium]
MNEVEKERLSLDGFMPPWVKQEHWARFEFSSPLVENKIIADCACGSGIGSKIFARSAKMVFAYDISPNDIEKAKIDASKNLVFSLADARRLPLANQAIDAFVSLETIEHIVEDTKFLSEVRRVLKNDGTFICSTPNRTVSNPGKTLSCRPANKFHVREYSQNEFVELLQKYFKTIELFGQNPQSKFRTALTAMLGKILPGHLSVRIIQFFKLSRLIWDSNKKHSVIKMNSNQDYEYIIAVCH